MKRLVLIGLAALALAGCGQSWNDKHGLGDAPVGNANDGPAYIVNMPDTFMNVAFKCLGPNGVYAHTREAAPVIIKDDANCAPGSPYARPLEGKG